jgi:hypothetical protein
LGNYETEGLLGTCGAVETYSARRADAPPGSNQVVIKLLRPDRVPATEWPRVSARFVAAARRMQTELPGMGRVLEISEWSGDVMVVSEMAPGLDLRHLMALGHQETGQLGLDGALVAMLGGEIARVLADAHAGDPPLLHLGLGLGNVLVAPDGQVTVVDFGLCASLRGQMDHPIDKWFLLGPELLSAGANEPTPILGKRADLYSLGALMYAMATGEPPFKASSRAHLAELARGTVPEIPGVPACLNAAIRALTAPDPDDRPASANEVMAWLVPGKDTPTQRQEKRAAALRSFFLGLKTPAPVILPSPTVAAPLVAPPAAAKPPIAVAPTRKPRRLGLMVAGVLGVGLFAGAGIAAFQWAQHYAERSNAQPVAHVTRSSPEIPSAPAKFNPELPAPAIHTASPDAQPDVPADAEGEGDAAHAAVPAPKRKLPRIPERLDINTEPEGADVWVDGVLMGQTPADLLVGPGGHRVVVIAAGHRMFREVYNTTDGEYVRRPLEPVVAASRGSAFVNVTCRTPNRFPVLVDDEETGQLCPARMIPVAPGKHQVAIFVPVRRGTVAAEISLPEGPKPYVVTFKE